MTKVTLNGKAFNTIGNLPKVGTKAPGFKLTKNDLSETELNDYAGKTVILNIFPSIDTPVCATSVRTFNKEASELKNTVVLCISKDLPFAQARFCGGEGLDNVIALSDFRTGKFGKEYGIEITEGPLSSLLARVVIILNKNKEVIYKELVKEISQEPNYEAALNALM